MVLLRLAERKQKHSHNINGTCRCEHAQKQKVVMAADTLNVLLETVRFHCSSALTM